MQDKRLLDPEDAHTLGNELLDYQHGNIIKFLNRLHADTLKSTYNSEQAILDMDFLESFTAYHIKTEERMMCVRQDVSFDAHLTDHREFLVVLMDAKEELAAGKKLKENFFKEFEEKLLVHFELHDEEMIEKVIKEREIA